MQVAHNKLPMQPDIVARGNSRKLDGIRVDELDVVPVFLHRERQAWEGGHTRLGILDLSLVLALQNQACSLLTSVR
jgi:hypothetical protein